MTDETRDKIFLLGVGCQKGGTSWLHSQLKTLPEVNLGLTKEYQVLEVHFGGADAVMKKRLDRAQGAIESLEALREKALLIRLLTFHAEIRNYYEYFNYLWLRHTDVRVVGDLTPANAVLSTKALAEVKFELEKRGFTVKVVFLMRDPIERIWSAVRMARRDSVRDGIPVVGDEETQMREAFAVPATEARTRYERTIERVDSVFDEDDVFYTFYEKLFEAETHADIKAFLGLSSFEPDIGVKVNASAKSELALSADLQREMYDYYAETYEYCDRRFNTSSIWSNHRR